MLKKADLVKILSWIKGRGYKAYQEIRGSYEMGTHLLYIDHVQGDPFASPSRVRVQVPLSRAGFPDYLLDGIERKVALGDILARR
ncbi:MAG TPA: ABC-ATPase domain-containing protein, partial [Syntrophothermus lipocalidus]|nr:ABC-ATPase domain-containing protein [Syntrophothermus lipocalidus]